MVSKCANPTCSAPFLYLHEGKLFRIEVGTNAVSGPTNVADRKPSYHAEYYWLCDACSKRMTLKYKPGVGVATAPIARARKAAS
jgi:hypothetical protein